LARWVALGLRVPQQQRPSDLHPIVDVSKTCPPPDWPFGGLSRPVWPEPGLDLRITFEVEGFGAVTRMDWRGKLGIKGRGQMGGRL
jgi:hypothetical protein